MSIGGYVLAHILYLNVVVLTFVSVSGRDVEAVDFHAASTASASASASASIL